MITTKEVAQKYNKIGAEKIKQPTINIFVLAIFAGFFIAVAGAAAMAAATSVSQPSLIRIVNGLIFPAGLAMIVITGSELFTGNCLLIIPVMEKTITAFQMIRILIVVYLGNFVGSVFFVVLSTYGNVYKLFDGVLADYIIHTAVAKVHISFTEGLLKGILCNIIVCLAAWVTYFATTASEKLINLYFPILMFVVLGFEHSVANMSFITSGLFIKMAYGIEAPDLTWSGLFIKNLVPVTLGNIIGGILVGFAYWFVYLKPEHTKDDKK